jgi:hypothetical protein
MMIPSHGDVVVMLTNDVANLLGPNVNDIETCSSAPDGNNEPVA